jgi:phytanoyl-CoA hydroxylase
MHESFKQNGFLVLKNVFKKEELDKLRRLSEHLISNSDDYYNPLDEHYLKHRFDNGVLYDLYQRHPEFRSFASNKIILDEVEKILGDTFYLYVNSFLYKPKGKYNEVPLHQDFLSRPHESEKILAWISLDHATKENGCLKVIPGSHKNGFRKWFRVSGETHHDRIEVSDEDYTDLEYVELEPGDVLIFSNYLIHGSDQNHSSKKRRAYRVVYKALDTAEIPRSTPLIMRGGLPESIKRKAVQPKVVNDTNESDYSRKKQSEVKKIISKIKSRAKKIF